ncbi:MAG: MlaD family protein [Leptospiraceae bacterium]|nr:MlaD family protein [Leptospiraceae bacterium]MDW7976820.1 MlaD family protein [Leptospiraceae bacterium]
MKFVQHFIVGILFAGSLALVGYFTIVSDSGPFARRGKQIVVYFDQAEGIKNGSKVTVLGVPAGTVVDMDLVSVDENDIPVPDTSPKRVRQRVAVAIELKKEVVFYDNYQISLKNESILSGKIVAIDPGGSDLKNHRRLNVTWYNSLDIERLGKSAIKMNINDIQEKKATVILSGINAGDPIAGLSELIAENRHNVRRTLQNIAEITDKINQGKGTVGQLINDSKLYDDANTLISNAKITVREMRENLEDTREQAPVTNFIRILLTSF